MSLLRRRTLLIAGAFIALLSACNATPVYGPNGSGSKLSNRILVKEPSSEQEYQVTRRFEERLGRADPAPMKLTFSVTNRTSDLGTTTTGSTTRNHRYGTLRYTLTNTATDETIDSGNITGFTGNSATGNTAASLAAERDAIRRLMILLADKLVDRMYVIDPALLP